MDQMEDDDDAPEMLRVTPAEIRAARQAWLDARDADDDVPQSRVHMLFAYYRFLISVEARQIADGLHDAGGPTS